VTDNSTPTLVGNEITGNVADTGGGIYVLRSSLILNDPDDNVYGDNQPDDIYYEPLRE